MTKRWVVLLLAVPFVARAELVDRIAAIVNSDIITLSEVEKRAKQEPQPEPDPDPEKRAEQHKEMLTRTLDGLINEQLMQAQMKENGIEVTDSEVEQSIASIKKAQNLSDEAFAAELGRAGFTMEAYKKFLRQHLARLKLLNMKVRSRVKITDDDLKSEYSKFARDQAQDFECHARHILIKVLPGASKEQVEAARKRALEIADEARKPGVDFAALARAKSEGSSAAEGGDLGTFRRGEMQADFDRAAFSLPEGGVSEPVRSKQGWHIIKLVEKKPLAVLPFDEVKDKLRDKLVEAQLDRFGQQYMRELRDSAVVEIKL